MEILVSIDPELAACVPQPVALDGFNPRADIPYGVTIEHIQLAMNEFVDFLGFINQQLYGRGIPRLETLLMPANFSGVVGEFMAASIPKYCRTIVRNQYHNGHPDLIPAGTFPGNAVQHSDQGIEIKASRYLKGWQGHNPEDTWLMVFVFESNRPRDRTADVVPVPFRFLQVVGARLTKADWAFAGRSPTSRRTITASVTRSGLQKMLHNWIYRAPDLS
jgi:hypothetical protein